MVSRSPMIETATSFSVTPGNSTRSTRSSFVSCISTDGSHGRAVCVAPAIGRPAKVSNNLPTSTRLPNGSQRSTVPNGRQRSLAIVLCPPWNLAGLPGPAIEYICHISSESNTVNYWVALFARDRVTAMRLGCSGCLGTVVGLALVAVVVGGAVGAAVRMLADPLVPIPETTQADGSRAQRKLFELGRQGRRGEPVILTEGEINAL